MYKKIIILIISMILLVGCKNTNINKLSLQEIIDTSIKSEVKDYNINAKGYRYYLPAEFSVVKDEDYIQQLLSKNNIYFPLEFSTPKFLPDEQPHNTAPSKRILIRVI